MKYKLPSWKLSGGHVTSSVDYFRYLCGHVTNAVSMFVTAQPTHLSSCKYFCEAQARVRQGSARDGSQGERPQSLNPCLELTLKLVAPPSFLPTTTRKSNFSNVYGWNGSGKVGRDNGRYIGAKWVMLLCWDGSHRG